MHRNKLCNSYKLLDVYVYLGPPIWVLPRAPKAQDRPCQRARGINDRGPCRVEVGSGEDVADARYFVESSRSASSRYLSVAGGVRRCEGFSATLVLEDGVAEPSPYPLRAA